MHLYHNFARVHDATALLTLQDDSFDKLCAQLERLQKLENDPDMPSTTLKLNKDKVLTQFGIHNLRIEQVRQILEVRVKEI